MSQLSRRLLSLALLAGLAACGEATAPVPEGQARDPSVMIASAALFDPGRFAGRWHVVADLGEGQCGITHEDWQSAGAGQFRVSGLTCSGRTARRFSGEAHMIGPGRIALSAPARPELEDQPLWVLWVDADYRVAALGSPSGKVGIILSRTVPPRPDLMTAAREVMEFNGYRPDSLHWR